MAGWALLPLRAFLGITFCFAGLQKLANPNFFNANSPSGIQAQLIASIRISPLHSLLGHFLHYATPIGVLIALGELAVGLGTLLGLWTRLAALGGAVLSLTLFLTVSYHASPYYTGADIVFLFAWLPLIVAGSGGVLSLDAVIASWTKREAKLGTPIMVPVRFEVVQQVCGHYDNGSCEAQRGAPCDTKGCPFLAQANRETPLGEPDDVRRRALILGGAAVGTVAAAGLIAAGADALLGRAFGGTTSPGGGTATLTPGGKSGTPATTQPPSNTQPQSSGTTQPPSATQTPAKPAGTLIGPSRDVPVGGAATFQDPASGDPGIVLQPTHGSFVAFDTVCPHAGCTVGYSKAADLLVCPCHGSEFNPNTGAVETGPAPRGLTAIHVAEGPDGQLYVDG